jgi:hypothetical protein
MENEKTALFLLRGALDRGRCGNGNLTFIRRPPSRPAGDQLETILGLRSTSTVTELSQVWRL